MRDADAGDVHPDVRARAGPASLGGAAVTHGFMMTCYRCQRAEFAGPTALYREGGVERVAYMIPDAPCADWELCVGTSAGSGDTFECRVCHSYPTVPAPATESPR